MNYLLSVYANRVTGVNNVELHCGGKPIKSTSGRFKGDNIKENVLECIHKGLRFAAVNVTHDDKLFIEVQNVHLVNWLMGRTEYKDYCKYLDVVFTDIEQVDCSYRFIFEKNPRAKKATLSQDCCVVEPNHVGLYDMLKEFEG